MNNKNYKNLVLTIIKLVIILLNNYFLYKYKNNDF